MLLWYRGSFFCQEEGECQAKQLEIVFLGVEISPVQQITITESSPVQQINSIESSYQLTKIAGCYCHRNQSEIKFSGNDTN